MSEKSKTLLQFLGANNQFRDTSLSFAKKPSKKQDKVKATLLSMSDLEAVRSNDVRFF